MKRHFWILIISLLLGSVVNIAVAWMVAIYNPAMHTQISSDDFISFTLGNAVFRYHIGDFHAAKIYECRLSGTVTESVTREDAISGGLPKWAVFNPEYDGVEGYPLARRYEATGWPMISFACATFYSPANPQPLVVGGIELEDLPRMPTTQPMSTTLPTQPLLPGLIVNTLLYSLAAWVLISGPFIVRRVLRVRRKQCTGCGYPIGMSMVCTECGQKVLGDAKTNN